MQFFWEYGNTCFPTYSSHLSIKVITSSHIFPIGGSGECGGGKSAVFTCSFHVLSTSFLTSLWAIMFQERLALNFQFNAVPHCPPLKFTWPSWDHRGGYRKTVLQLSSRLSWVNPLKDQGRVLQAVRLSIAAAQFAPSTLSKAAHAFNSVPFWLQ